MQDEQYIVPFQLDILGQEYADSIATLAQKRREIHSPTIQSDIRLFEPEALVTERNKLVIHADIAEFLAERDDSSLNQSESTPNLPALKSIENSASLEEVLSLLKQCQLVSIRQQKTLSISKSRTLANDLTEDKLNTWREKRYSDSVKIILDNCATAGHIVSDILTPYQSLLLDIAVYSVDGHRRRKLQEFTFFDKQSLCDLKDLIMCAELSTEKMRLLEAASGVATSSTTLEAEYDHSSQENNGSPKSLKRKRDQNKCENEPEEIISNDAVHSQSNESHPPETIAHPYDRKPASSGKKGTELYGKCVMEDTRFIDIPMLRLGTPYAYLHDGDCRHEIVFTGIRLLNPTDELVKAFYPILRFINTSGDLERRCRMCKVYAAAKVTLYDKLAEYNPCYFCNRCFHLLHFDQSGNPLYEFKAFPYLHP